MTMQPVWLPSLETLVGVDQCETQAARRREYAIDGLVPGVIVRPDTADHVAAVLQWAQREKLAVLPRGSGTKIGLGGIAKRLDIVLSTSRLTQISEYDAANFTLTAGAGMTFSQVAQLTAAHGQMLPLQYPFSAATLGGLIAANAYSPKRRLYGGVRDLLLGLRIALPSGEVAHFGGKVVKNVAGYDMCKLFLGSVGALGVIVETTFKLYALPERDETLLAAFPALGQGAAAAAQLMGTQLLPAHILLLNAMAARAVAPQVATQVPTGEALLLVNCEGMDEAVGRQLGDIARICQGHGASTAQVLSGDAQLQLRACLEAMTLSPLPQLSPLEGEGAGGGALRVRLGTLPSRVSMVMEAVSRALDPTAPGAMIIGDCGVGLVILCLGPDGLAAGAIDEPLLRVLRELSGLVVANEGYAIVESAPPQVKTQLGVWGPPPSSLALLKALKHRFDPEAILSPGRFIGGL
jgi:glycolate oxidase FAD binding subunit